MKAKPGALRSVPLRRRLLATAFAGIVPLALFAALGLGVFVHDQQQQAKQRALESSRQAATTIEIELRRSITILQALAESPLLENADLDAYSALVERVLPLVPGWRSVLVATPEGDILRRISRQKRAAGGPMAEEASFRTAVASREPVVGQLGRGPSGTLAIPIRVPVLQEGALRYVLTAVATPEMLGDARDTRTLPADWVGSVFDRNGLRLARTALHEESIGQPALPSLAALLASPQDEGVGYSVTREGRSVYVAFVRLPASGWTVTTAIPTSEFTSAAKRAFAVYGSGLLLSLLLAFAAAIYASRRVTRPVHALHVAARHIGNGEIPPALDSDIKELQDVGRALIDASDSRRRSEFERDAYLQGLTAARDELALQVADLETLQRLNHRLLQLPTLSAQLQAILETLCLLHNSPFGHIALSRDGGRLRVYASQGLSPQAVDLLETVEPGQGACGLAISEGCRIVIADTFKDERFAPYVALARQEGFAAVHSTPLRSNIDGTIGALTIQMREPREPTLREQRLADLCASKAAVFIDRARIQDAALQSQRRLRVALESSVIPYGIATSASNSTDDLTLDWEYLNPVGVALLQATGRRDEHAGWAQQRIFDLCQQRLRAGTPQSIELEGQDPAGTMRWLHVVATPFEHNVAVWFVDITARKDQEQLLREADQQKDRFLAILAHELRNPLAPIRQAATLIASLVLTEQQRARASDTIERQVSRMGLLLNDLLDVSRITLGKIQLRLTVISLQDCLSAALESVNAMAQQKSHALTVRVPSEPVQIDADALRIEQIFTNLLTNAMRYTPQGGAVAVEVRIDGRSVRVSISDNGIGIALEDFESIFTMFSQIDPRSEQSSNGLGIGLSLARELARLHGGDIEVESDGPGRGSRFTLSLPIAAPIEPRTCETPTDAGSASLLRKVLVVDDDPDIADTMAELLALEGHDVVVAHDGASALARYELHRPDVVISDIGMPGMSGHEVARAIREMEGGEGVRLIAMTGWGQAHDQSEAYAAGFDHHVTKPADIMQIYDLVAQG